MIKKIIFPLFIVCIYLKSFAQIEKFQPLNFNAQVYKEYQISLFKKNNNALYLQQGNVIIISDTLTLPFIDDFSYKTVKSYNFNMTNIDSTIYALGRCITIGGFSTEEYSFMTKLNFRYFYNLSTKKIDSIANDPFPISFIDSPSLCLDYKEIINLYYPAAYRVLKVDSITGRTLDSTIIKADTLIRLAKLIYTHLDSKILWLDNFTYVNETYPIDPPTIGVATLDGLNEKGLPYNKSSVLAYGIADFLTSRPIDLGGLTNNDSVYFSFFYEPKGYGDYPNINDSLLLEFKDSKDQWNTLWSIGGFNTDAEVKNYFTQILFKIPFPKFPTDPIYFYKGFQFRFKNYASLTGNTDHWHLDYIRLDKNRSFVDTLIKDVSFVYSMPCILKEYTLMPPDHFVPDSSLTDSILIYNNYLGSPFQNDYCIEADTNNVNSFKFCPIYNTAVNQIFRRSTKDFNIPKQLGDSSTYRISVYTKSQADLSSNDTLRGLQIFSNIMSYDDGSAEKSYGLQGNGLKKFAYEYNFKIKDTLSGIRIHFSNIDENVKDLIFNINVWKSIELNTSNDVLLKEFVNKKPTYIDPVNSFIYYKLDTPLIFEGKFYVGYTQTDLRNLQIGYDVNSTRGKDKIFIFSSGSWKKSSVNLPGSPMIQLIVDGTCKNCIVSNTKSISNINFAVYPNPTQGILNIQSNENHSFSFRIFNTLGQLIMEQTNSELDTIDVSSLNNGLYYLNILSENNQYIYRIIKQ